MPSSINRAIAPASHSPQPEPDQAVQTPDREPYNPETDPLIIEARARLKTDYITQLCGEGSTEPSGKYGPIVAYERKWRS